MSGKATLAPGWACGVAPLQSAGIEHARREALLIWASLMGVSPADAWLFGNDQTDVGLSARYAEAVRRRAAGEPFQYVVGRAGFRGLDLEVDRNVLIPRPETEGLVTLALEWARERWHGQSWGTAIDVGTGSGCIALSLAIEGEFTRVIGTDTSASALAVAARNKSAAMPKTPVALCCGTLLAAVQADSADVIVSNPPYVTVSEYPTLERGVRDYEPSIALLSGATGLDHTSALLQDAARVLRSGGFLAIEVDSRRSEPTRAVAKAHGWDTRVDPDVFGRPRYLMASRSLT